MSLHQLASRPKGWEEVICMHFNFFLHSSFHKLFLRKEGFYLFERQTHGEKTRETASSHALIHSPSAYHSRGGAGRSWQPRTQCRASRVGGYQGPNYFSHHLLPARVFVSRKLGSGAGTGTLLWVSGILSRVFSARLSARPFPPAFWCSLARLFLRNWTTAYIWFLVSASFPPQRGT